MDRVLVPAPSAVEVVGVATTREMAELQRMVAELRQCVGALRARFGETPPVLRVANDVDRLNIDVAELGGLPEPRVPSQAQPERVQVPDTPYDPELWRGADDEGVGGYHGHHR